ncbi:hypothetical protein ElyMa_000470800 [Elysia marginata]|uniref:Serine protease n=1 Tax=Elysia marginata TaxID=1093978 RepID=A0AAV4FRQ8_9GAST|nr:hypothetical protein ElyMa_000470800 [Elysia marginata]
MKSVCALKVDRSIYDRDRCEMLCVTCDEDLGDKIQSAYHYRFDKLNHQDLSDLGLLPSFDKDCRPVLIVSHPHGKAKKITAGEVKYRFRDGGYLRLEYNTPTCPGSSGAPVFGYYRDVWSLSPVHSGTFGKTSTKNNNHPNPFKRLLNKLTGHKTTQEQINYGFDWWKNLDYVEF